VNSLIRNDRDLIGLNEEFKTNSRGLQIQARKEEGVHHGRGVLK